MSNDLVRISKLLSFILRHDPASHGIVLDEHGYANVEELLNKTHLDMDTLIMVVKNNDKQRFSFNEDETLIRANQGHSIDVDLQLEPVDPPDTLYHGTVSRFVASIREKGLLKMNRQYVHLSDNIITANKVGQRRGAAVILTILSSKMAKDGHKFFLSKNKVWLTDHVPAEYIA